MSRTDPIQDFYERWPYPAPPDHLDGYRDRRQVPIASPAASFHLFWPARSYTAELDILHAGCGTTQVVAAALWDRQARITAIDVSQSSLEQTRALAHRYELSNIDFHRLPLEEVASLNRQFDLIVCSGVLHHLDDPDRGLKALRSVLRPDGTIFIMVYGRHGRLGVYMMQEYCRLLQLKPDEHDLGELSQVLPHLAQDHPIMPVLKKAQDVASANGIADLLLNPRDRAFTVPEIYQWLDRCGMKLQRWLHRADYLPQCSTLALTPHLRRILSLPEAEQHALVELFRGHLNTHSLLACRNDRPVESYQIRFDEPHWRRLIPIVSPTTGSRPVTDRPGIAMMLFNSAHEFPVGAMLIEQVDVPLLRLMDGRRTLARIAEESRLPNANLRVRVLYQNLWNFDHVMFRYAP